MTKNKSTEQKINALEEAINNPKKEVHKMSDERGSLLSHVIKNPWKATCEITGIVFVTPAVVALVWGVYNPDSFMSVLGMAGRRAGGAVITETQPIGESLVNGTSGKGFRPGQRGDGSFNESVRPGGR